jgi:hypothetical protein
MKEKTKKKEACKNASKIMKRNQGVKEPALYSMKN